MLFSLLALHFITLLPGHAQKSKYVFRVFEFHNFSFSPFFFLPFLSFCGSDCHTTGLASSSEMSEK